MSDTILSIHNLKILNSALSIIFISNTDTTIKLIAS